MRSFDTKAAFHVLRWWRPDDWLARLDCAMGMWSGRHLVAHNPYTRCVWCGVKRR